MPASIWGGISDRAMNFAYDQAMRRQARKAKWDRIYNRVSDTAMRYAERQALRKAAFHNRNRAYDQACIRNKAAKEREMIHMAREIELRMKLRGRRDFKRSRRHIPNRYASSVRRQFLNIPGVNIPIDPRDFARPVVGLYGGDRIAHFRRLSRENRLHRAPFSAGRPKTASKKRKIFD